MIIEETVRNYLEEHLGCPVWMEVPKGITVPEQYVLVQRTGNARENFIYEGTIALQSYAGRLNEAAELNEQVKDAVDQMSELDSIGRISLNSDYNFTDTQTKKYRYQAVYEITYYKED